MSGPRAASLAKGNTAMRGMDDNLADVPGVMQRFLEIIKIRAAHRSGLCEGVFYGRDAK